MTPRHPSIRGANDNKPQRCARPQKLPWHTSRMVAAMMETRRFFSYRDLICERLPGGVERVIYTGKQLQVVEYHFPANQKFDVHSHVHEEQMGYLVSGRMGFVIGGEERVLLPGDFYHAAPGVAHGAQTFELPSVLIDVFAPTRSDLLATSNRFAVQHS